MTNEDYIRRTLTLAKEGLGTTFPNPMVGAVIVKNNKIIGEGYHQKQGGPHAEINAINNSSESPRGSTIYVNLEPCCHTNKVTPPCAQRLIQEGIKKVVICNLDPNPFVNGKGVELLRSQGIEVEHGVLKEEGEKLNEVFFLSQILKRPFINLKTASTLDGKVSMLDGKSQWITGEKARHHVHKLRAIHQGIIIGAETLRKDNPKLTVRLPLYAGEQPRRIVFTKSGVLPKDSYLFTDECKDLTLIYTQNDLNFDFPLKQVVKVGHIHEALDDLYSKKLINLLLESGSSLSSEFFKLGVIDRISLYLNPSFLGNGQSIFTDLGVQNLDERPRLSHIESEWIGEDLYLSGRILKG